MIKTGSTTNPVQADPDDLKLYPTPEDLSNVQDPIILRKEAAHSEYEELGASIGITVAEKQKAYGDSFGKAGGVLRILYPDGIRPEQYDDALAVTRIIDKLFRIATNGDAFGESPYRDIAGYGILGMAKGEHDGSSTTEDQG